MASQLIHRERGPDDGREARGSMAKQEEKVEEDYHVRIVYKEMLEVVRLADDTRARAHPFFPGNGAIRHPVCEGSVHGIQ